VEDFGSPPDIGGFEGELGGVEKIGGVGGDEVARLFPGDCGDGVVWEGCDRHLAVGGDVQFVVRFLDREKGEAVAVVIETIGADGGDGVDVEIGKAPFVTFRSARQQMGEVVANGNDILVGVAGEMADVVRRHSCGH